MDNESLYLFIYLYLFLSLSHSQVLIILTLSFILCKIISLICNMSCYKLLSSLGKNIGLLVLHLYDKYIFLFMLQSIDREFTERIKKTSSCKLGCKHFMPYSLNSCLLVTLSFPNQLQLIMKGNWVLL